MVPALRHLTEEQPPGRTSEPQEQESHWVAPPSPASSEHSLTLVQGSARTVLADLQTMSHSLGGHTAWQSATLCFKNHSSLRLMLLIRLPHEPQPLQRAILNYSELSHKQIWACQHIVQSVHVSVCWLLCKQQLHSKWNANDHIRIKTWALVCFWKLPFPKEILVSNLQAQEQHCQGCCPCFQRGGILSLCLTILLMYPPFSAASPFGSSSFGTIFAILSDKPWN